VKQVLYADFQNADPQGRLRLICAGTQRDLQTRNIELMDGMRFTFSDGELMVAGAVEFSEEEGCWVAVINWDEIVEI